jgi:hypothetical protein
MYCLLPYALMFLHSAHSVLMLRILYSVLFTYYCSVLFIVYVTLPPDMGPIAVGNKYIISSIYIKMDVCLCVCVCMYVYVRT